MHYNKLDRKTGKTTSAILTAIAEAYAGPGKPVKVKDPGTSNKDMERITQRKLNTFIYLLELSGFKSYIDGEYLYLRYDQHLKTLVKDENGRVYSLTRVG